MTKDHKLWVALNKRNALSHSSGGWKSEIKVSVGLIPWTTLRKNPFQASFLVSGGCWRSWPCLVCRCISLISAFIFTWALCVPLYPNLSFLFFCKHGSHIELGPHLTLVSAPFNWLHQWWHYFQTHWHSEMLAVSLSTHEFCQGVIQSIIVHQHCWGSQCRWRRCIFLHLERETRKNHGDLIPVLLRFFLFEERQEWL